MYWSWFSFTEFLKDWFKMLFRLQLFFFQAWVKDIWLFFFGINELSSFICDWSVSICKLSFIVLKEKLKCSRAISSTLSTWMRCNSNHSNPIKLSKVVILKLLRDCPWNKVTRRPNATLELFSYCLLTYFTFETDLNCTENVRKFAHLCCFLEWAHKYEYLMSWCIWKHL